MTLNDPEVVKNEYANESRFERRRANSIGHAHLTESIPPFAGPLAVTRNMTIFVATK